MDIKPILCQACGSRLGLNVNKPERFVKCESCGVVNLLIPDEEEKKLFEKADEYLSVFNANLSHVSYFNSFSTNCYITSYSDDINKTHGYNWFTT